MKCQFLEHDWRRMDNKWSKCRKCGHEMPNEYLGRDQKPEPREVVTMPDDDYTEEHEFTFMIGFDLFTIGAQRQDNGLWFSEIFDKDWDHIYESHDHKTRNAAVLDAVEALLTSED